MTKLTLSDDQVNIIKEGAMLHTVDDGFIYYLPQYYRPTDEANVFEALSFGELSQQQQMIITGDMLSELKQFKYEDKIK